MTWQTSGGLGWSTRACHRLLANNHVPVRQWYTPRNCPRLAASYLERLTFGPWLAPRQRALGRVPNNPEPTLHDFCGPLAKHYSTQVDMNVAHVKAFDTPRRRTHLRLHAPPPSSSSKPPRPTPTAETRLKRCVLRGQRRHIKRTYFNRRALRSPRTH